MQAALLLLALFAADARPSSVAFQKRPDIIVITADDQWFRGSMDVMHLTRARIGLAGRTFTNAHVISPLCCPSRVGGLTGQPPSVTGIFDNEAPFGGFTMFNDSVTIATMLQGAGYRTAFVGKYLNEYSTSYVPPGWTDWRALIDPIGYQDYAMNLNGTITPPYGTGQANYSTNVIFDHAVDMIAETPLDQPLFMSINPNAPHVNCKATAADKSAVAFMPLNRPPSHNEADVSDKAPWIRALPLLTASDISKIDTVYRTCLATLPSIDRGVERVFAALEAAGRLSNAVVMYTSDNGRLHGEYRLDGGKKCAYAECTQVPLLIRAPGAVAGVTDNRLVNSLDLPVTILDYAGVTPPTPMPGLSLRPVLEGTVATWRTQLFVEWLGQNRPKFNSVREDGYLLIDYVQESQGAELYDLFTDPYLLVNVYADPAYAEVRARLEAALLNR